ncbi:MAG: hypothetical protein MRY21_04355 [Simkaniaceae bacterium]|nr:hypothetical protein [Simkaniaceae bacterium]
MLFLTLKAEPSQLCIEFTHRFDLETPVGRRKKYTIAAKWLQQSPSAAMEIFRQRVQSLLVGNFEEKEGALVGRLVENQSDTRENQKYYNIAQATAKVFRHYTRLTALAGSGKLKNLTRFTHLSPKKLRSTPIHNERVYPISRSARYEFPITFESLKQTELFGRVPRVELTPFLSELENLEITYDELKKAAVAFVNARLDHEIFERTDWPLVAFLAHFHGFITKNQLCQLQLLDRYLQMDSPKAVAAGVSILTPEMLAKHKLPEMEIMDLPPLERILLKVVFLQETRHEIKHITSLIVYSNFDELIKDRRKLLILSPTLVDRKHAAQFPKTSMKINPVFGYSKRMDRWMSIKTRDATVPSRFFSAPEKVHEQWCATSYDIYYHDTGYHTFVDSANPHRAFYRDLAKQLLRQNRRANLMAAIQFLDRDMRIFSSKEVREYYKVERYVQHPNYLFWANMVYTISREGIRETITSEEFCKALKALCDKIPFGKRGYEHFKELNSSADALFPKIFFQNMDADVFNEAAGK